MTKVSMKALLLLLLVYSVAHVLGEDIDEESIIDLQELLINVQSTLKTFKQDQDEIRKSADARFDKFEKSVQNFKEEVGELKTGLTDRLDKFELKVDDKLGQCQRENLPVLLLSFTDKVFARLNKIELQISDLAAPRDCADIYNRQSELSGVYTIQPRGRKPFQVYCDMTTDGGGWTVFQKRGNFPGVKENDFYRNWQDYKDGFGDFKKEFWMGLSKISLMTRPENGDQELRIDMATSYERKYAEYKNFTVQDEKQLFRLSIGSYSGDAGNSLFDSNLQKFTTHDSDNDEFRDNCAVKYQGAWWYNACSFSSLNGLNTRITGRSGYGIWWLHFNGLSLAQSEMKFRPMAWTHKNS